MIGDGKQSMRPLLPPGCDDLGEGCLFILDLCFLILCLYFVLYLSFGVFLKKKTLGIYLISYNLFYHLFI